MQEIEYKIRATPADAARIARGPAVAELAETPACTVRLRTIYHDTPDGALAARGIALRLRHDGRGWTQTVKAGRAMAGGLSAAEETEVAVPDGVVDLDALPDPVAARIREIAGLAEIGPVFASEMTRTRRRLGLPCLGRVEMALDLGEIRAGERAEPFAEIEFELLEGSPRAVFEAVRRVVPPGDLRPSTLSKAERGALLARTGGIAPAAAPRSARKVALDPGMTAEAGAHAVLSECLAQIGANLEAVAEQDAPEGPHQLRVGLRRLRSALDLFGEAIGGADAARLGAEARWLGLEVGRLRDLDVALGDLVLPEARALPDEPGFAALEAALAAAAEAERARLRTTLAQARAKAFLLDLTEFVATRGWLDPADWGQTARLARPLPALAAEALDRRFAKAAKKAKGIAGLDIEARHELRKALKKLRYGVEFFVSLAPEKAAKPFLKRLKTLQDVFGDLNDAAMAEGMFRGPESPGAGDAAAQRAAGIVLGIRIERARHGWEQAKGHWRELAGTRPFWRGWADRGA